MVATALEATGSAIGFLGGWLRDRLASIGGLSGDPEQYEPEQYEGCRQQGEGVEDWEEARVDGHQQQAGGRRKGARQGGGRTEQLLSGALMVAMMIIAIVVLRRCGQNVEGCLSVGKCADIGGWAHGTYVQNGPAYIPAITFSSPVCCCSVQALRFLQSC